MDGEVLAVLGLILLILFTAGILILPGVAGVEDLRGTKEMYERYVDVVVVFLSAVVALASFVMAVGLYMARRGMKDAYILGAVFLLMVRILLSLLDVAGGTELWLLGSVSHLLDLGIVILLLLAIRQE